MEHFFKSSELKLHKENIKYFLYIIMALLSHKYMYQMPEKLSCENVDIIMSLTSYLMCRKE